MTKGTLKRLGSALVLLAAVALAAPASTLAAPAAKGRLYYDGAIVRTVAVSAPIPHGGTDPIYVITNGVPQQLGVTAVAPGDPGYNGGSWAVYLVEFNAGVTPYLLTSDEAVLQAEDDGDVTITRAPAMDNRCPVQP